MDILSQFISVLCHSDWLFRGESCPCLDVHPGRLWSSALCLSPGNSLVSSWCDHSMLASLLWRCFHLKGVKSCFFILSESQAFTTICCYSTGHTSTFISRKIAPSHLQKTDIIFLWANDLRSYIYMHTCIHARLTALCPGLPGWACTRKVKPIWILLKLETVSGSSISWAICKSAPRSRQITLPAPHHSVFTGQMPFLSPSQQRQSTEVVV